MLTASHIDNIKAKEKKFKPDVKIIVLNFFLHTFHNELVFKNLPFPLRILPHINLTAPTILRL